MKIEKMSERSPDIEAIIENCRESKNYFSNGYRPAHLVLENYLTTGEHQYFEKDKLEYGQKTLGTIKFISPEFYKGCLWIGKKIQFQEGSKITGYATVTKIFNKILEKK